MKKHTENDRLPTWGYRLLRPVLAPIFKLYYHPKIENKEFIPIDGPIIFAGNHLHILDQCLVIISTKRVVHYMAKREYFDGPFAWFFKLTGVIRVDRAIHDDEAKELALNVLNRHRALGIFPEGTRNKTEEILLPFKLGTVSLAQKTGATIVPFAITGDYKFRSKNLTITFTEPFKVSEHDDILKANRTLENKIRNILEKRRDM